VGHSVVYSDLGSYTEATLDTAVVCNTIIAVVIPLTVLLTCGEKSTSEM
jgi:hypothetical protein